MKKTVENRILSILYRQDKYVYLLFNIYYLIQL